MMKSPAMRFVGMAAWLITALVTISVGLQQFGYDFLSRGFLARFPGAINYVALIAGVLSLIMFFMALSSKCYCCGDNSHVR